MTSFTARVVRRTRRAVAELAPRVGRWSVRTENQLLGTEDWKLVRPGPVEAVQGYADRVSVTSGEEFRLFVSTTAARFRATAYRMGYYRGKQGRQVWQSDWVTGVRQPEPELVPGVNMLHCDWRPSLTVPTRGWPEGCYLIKLVSDEGNDRWVPITVRSTSTRGRTVFVNSVTTWLAYNRWGGGWNIYGGPAGSVEDYHGRSRKVSFDRPYDKNGSYFNWYELPTLSLAEKMGLPLAYATDLELDGDLALFAGARALVFPGHDEYWTSGMFENAQKIRDAGTNLAFFGANIAYRHVRMEPSALGPNRVMVCYKNETEDPVKGDEATAQWRMGPNPRPESVITGVLYEGNEVEAPFVVVEPDSWIFEGTGAERGSSYPGLVRVEYDRLIEGMPVHRPLQALSDSPLVCRGVDTWANSCYYTVSSGAGVFSSGTLGWTPILPLGSPTASKGIPKKTQAFVLRTTENILRVFSEGPAGVSHPAVDNYDEYVRPLADLKYDYGL
jgi:hypothetical protein